VGVGKESSGVLTIGAREGQQGGQGRVPAAGKVLEGDDQRTLSPLYYDFHNTAINMTNLLRFCYLFSESRLSNILVLCR